MEMAPSLLPSLAVHKKLYNARQDAQLDADGQGKPLLSAADGQLHDAVILQAHLHSHALYERRDIYKIPLGYK